MIFRVAMIGSGVVGSIHAAHLASHPDVELTSVYNPELENATAFAGQYRVRSVASSVEEAVSEADAAIVCSPSALHFEQTKTCLEAGRHTLVELPPCGDVGEAEELGAMARQHGVLLGCAHTSRYLEPYARIHSAIAAGMLGEIEEISYIRYPQLPSRTWIDDALFHHAAHIVDLVMHWCGGITPLACFAFPLNSAAQSVSLLASLPSGRSLTAAISYGAKFPLSRMIVVGAKHTVDTDGFSYIRSDLDTMYFSGDQRDMYEGAIAAQDIHFIEACCGKSTYVPWAETEALLRTIQRFQALSRKNADISRLDGSKKNLIFD